MKPLVAIYGPTHTGKTDLAKDLYSRFPSELISVDSVQIYKGFDIGSNKPDKKELQEYPHHLIDILEPNETFSVGDFKKRSIKILQDADKQSKLPIFVGGTMMYFYSLLEGLADLPERDDLIRAELECDLETFGLDYLFKRLKDLDPEAALVIHQNDSQRILRAIEVCLITNEKFSEIQKNTIKEEIRTPLSPAIDISVASYKNELIELSNKINILLSFAFLSLLTISTSLKLL